MRTPPPESLPEAPMPGPSAGGTALATSTEPWDDWEDMATAPPSQPSDEPEPTAVDPVATAADGASADLADTAPRIRVFAQLELAGQRLAVDADHVIQALPSPPRLTPLPSRQAALRGVLKLRGQVVPVVDLRHWLLPATELAAGLPGNPHTMVLGHGGKVVGIGLDAIRGLLRVPTEQVQAVAHQAEDDNFFHSVINLPDSDELVMVLDPLRLMALTQAWASATPSAATGHAASAPAAATNGATNGATGQTPPHALVRMGEVVLAVPAEVVREVGHQPPLNRVFGKNPYLRAMTRWRGVDLPVLDPVQALALPLDEGPRTERPLLMVLHQHGRHAAVAVDEVLSVRSFALAELQSAAETGVPQAHLFAGATTLDGGPHHGRRVRLLDPAALLGWLGMADLPDRSAEASQPQPSHAASDTAPHLAGGHTASTNGPTARTAAHGLPAPQQALAEPAAPADANPGAEPDAHAYVVFDMGREWAAPVNLLQEVMPFPASFQPAAGADATQLGSCDWRGRTLPVLDLRPPRADGSLPPKEQARLLVVQACERQAGLVVDDVVALLPAHQGTHTRLLMAGREPTHLITVGQAPSRKTYEVLNFSRLSFFSALL